MSAGSGKTFVLCEFLAFLNSIGFLKLYVLIATVPKAICHIMDEAVDFGLPVHQLIPTKNVKQKKIDVRKRNQKIVKKNAPNPKAANDDKDDVVIVQDDIQDDEYEYEYDVRRMRPFAINLIAIGDLRRVQSQIVAIGNEVVFVLDEADLCFRDSKQTSAALDIARNAAHVLAMTGTVDLTSHMDTISHWIALVSNCAVTRRNIFALASTFVAHDAALNVSISRIQLAQCLGVEPDDFLDVDADDEETPRSLRERYRALVPARFGGGNVAPSEESFLKACNICREAMSRAVARHIALPENRQERAVVVVASIEHGHRMEKWIRDAFVAYGSEYSLKADDVLLLTKETRTRGITPRTVVDPVDPAPFPRFFLIIDRDARGIELSAYSRMYYPVYFNSQSTRTQTVMRLVRLSQTAPEVKVFMAHTGILSRLHERQMCAQSNADCLEDLKRLFTSQ